MMLSIHVSLVINLTSKLFYAFNMSSFSVSCLKRHMYCTFSLKVYIFLWLFLYQKKVMVVISPLSQQQAKIFGPVFFVCLYCAFQLVFFFFLIYSYSFNMSFFLSLWRTRWVFCSRGLMSENEWRNRKQELIDEDNKKSEIEDRGTENIVFNIIFGHQEE